MKSVLCSQMWVKGVSDCCQHTARLASLETGDSDSEDSDSEDSDDAPLVPRPAPVAPMDVDTAVDKKPPPKPRPKKLSRQERLDRDELERGRSPGG